jgi:AcrR family transcriptional regulator
LVAQGAPRTGRRPGNRDTRGQILDAARQAFAGRGFAATSIRAIAADAGVDAALVHHYFDSKQQLFLATVSLPQELPGLIAQTLDQGPEGLGERLVRTMLGVWDSELQPSLVAAIRTALAEPALTRSIGEFLTLELLGRVVDRDDLSAAEATRRSGLVASQMLGLIMGRYVLRLPALVDRPSEELVAEIGPTIQRYVDGATW